jgi:hypothetical protein
MTRPISIKDMRLFITGPDGETEVTGQVDDVAAEPEGKTLVTMGPWTLTFNLTPEQAARARYVLVVRRLLYEPLEYRLN